MQSKNQCRVDNPCNIEISNSLTVIAATGQIEMIFSQSSAAVSSKKIRPRS